MPSVTIRPENLTRAGPQLQVVIGASRRYVEALDIGREEEPEDVEGVALIDTGATCTVIQKGIADKLGLSPVGQAMISTASNEGVSCAQYEIDISLRERDIRFENLVVVEVPIILPPIICLIGRDMLAQGVFIYAGHDNSFTLSV